RDDDDDRREAPGAASPASTETGVTAPAPPGGNAALAALLAGEVEVLRFGEEAPRIEDVFLRATRGGLTP
ncbi:hypothetical protein ABTL56_19490, partial [Acinetobacter baumannii]